MSNELNSRLSALLLLTGCCNGSSDPNCTVAEKETALQREAPRLITSQDGVNLYCMYCDYSHPVYFTTPCGDTSWTEDHAYGKGQHESVPMQVNGQGCRK